MCKLANKTGITNNILFEKRKYNLAKSYVAIIKYQAYNTINTCMQD